MRLKNKEKESIAIDFDNKPPIVKKLPDSGGDLENIILIDTSTGSNIYKEYRFINGQWKLKATYS